MLTRRSDRGFTLIELLLTVSTLGFIMVGLAAVMFGSLKTDAETKVRLDESRDQQFAASYFGTDASAANSFLSGVTAGCGFGTVMVEFRGTSYDPTTFVASVTVVSYVFSTGTSDGKPAGLLRRQSCETPASPAPTYPLIVKSTQLVARNLVVTTPTLACTPSPCGASTVSIMVTANRRSSDTPFLLVGTRRTTP